jgi:hypothetical protein
MTFALAPANRALVEFLAEQGVDLSSPPGQGIARAMGTGLGGHIGDNGVSVYGYYLQQMSRDETNPSLLLFLVTTGRLVRYEWSLQGSLTTTVPLDRIASIEELIAGDTFTLRIHLDSSARVGAAQSEAEGSWAVRTEGVTHALTASEKTAVLALAEFSRALRVLVGA